MPEDTTLATLKEVRDYFGISGKDMIAQWRHLTDEDKRQLREGLGNGTQTY
jgi:hypothetical protein